MTQPPFSGNDFFDQIDSVARNLTGNAFRLKKNDPTAPQKFTEFVAQSEQDFGRQPQQQAQPQSFTDFEQAGFQVNPAGDRRAAILAQQPSSGESAFDQSIGRGLGALGRGALGVLKTHIEAEEAIRKPAAGIASEIRTFLPDEILGREIKAGPIGVTAQETAYDRAFAEARANGASLTEAFDIAREFQQNIPYNAGEFINPFLNPAAGPSAGVPGGPPVDFHLGTADVGSEIISPLNFIPVIGDPGLLTKPFGAGSRVVTGAGKKAVSAGGDYAAAVGRTGVGNVLDPVPQLGTQGRFIPEDIDKGPLRVFISAEQAAKGGEVNAGLPVLQGGKISSRPMTTITLDEPGFYRGKTISGGIITKQDLPETVFHVTSDSQRVKNSNVLRASSGEGGGLGGTQARNTVSFTTSANDADDIATELIRMGEVARAGSDDETIVIMNRIISEDAQRAGITAEAIGEADEIVSNIYGADWRTRGNLSRVEVYRAYLTRRQSLQSGQFTGGEPIQGLRQDPLIIMDEAQARLITPESVEVIAVPSRTLPDAPLITDRVSGDFLNEIQVHGDIDISSVTAARGIPEDATAAAGGAGDVEPKFSSMASGDYTKRTRKERIQALASGELAQNYTDDLEIFADRIWREQSADEARRALLGGDTTIASEIPTANTPDLALGQGGNKGVLIEYSTEGMKGRPDLHSKPGLKFIAQESGNAEISVRLESVSSLGKRAISAVLDPKIADKREMRLFERAIKNSERFDREVLPDGKIRFTPKQAITQPTTPPTGTAAAARGAGGGRFVPGVDPDTIVTPRVGSDTRFLELAAAQRGNAERLGTDAMMDAGGSGIRQFLTEAVGDIIQRMSRQMPDDYSATIEKVQRGIRELRRPNFADELERQLRSNYDFGVEKGKITKSFEAHKAGILDIQSQYAVAHSELPVINQAHRDAQAAAVAFGEQRYADSLAALRRIESHLGSEEAFDAYRLEGAQPATGTAAARGAGVDLDEKLALDPDTPKLFDQGKLDTRTPQAQILPSIGVEGLHNRYWWHRPPSHVPIPKDGGLNAYILKAGEAKAILGDVNVKGIWLGASKDRGEGSVLVDISKLDNSNMFVEQSGIVHRGDIPKSAIVEPPTTPATGTAAARQVTPQQQAIIDDVGTGALPADDVAVDAARLTPEQQIEAEVAAIRTGGRGGAAPPDVQVAPLPEGTVPDLTDFGEQLGITFREGKFGFKIPISGKDITLPKFTPRKVGEFLRLGKADPSLKAQRIGQRLGHILNPLKDEGRNLVERAMSYVNEIGTREGLFGKLDEFGRSTD